MAAEKNQKRWRKRNKQLVHARSKLYCKHSRGTKLECTSVCNTEFVNGSVYYYTVAEHVANDSSHIDTEYVIHNSSHISTTGQFITIYLDLQN